MQIEQAIYGSQDAGGYRFLARSPGFGDDWLALAERLCTGFGERPAGVACPEAVFARPFGAKHVAVVQVADQGKDDAGRPGALGFRLLVLPRRLYQDIGGEPFFIADQFPPSWEARGELPTLEWTAGSAPYRTVDHIQTVLNVPESPTLLGGAQVLVDGGRLAFERPAPDKALLKSLWALLPFSTRAELWPASYAFGNALGFHAVVLPKAAGPGLEHHHTEAQAGDYPEGRYEFNLQVAAESGNQADLDALFSRRSRAQTLRLALLILAVFIIVPIIINKSSSPRLKPSSAPSQKQDKKGPAEEKKPAPAVKPAEKEKVAAKAGPPDFPRLTEPERAQLALRLQELGGRLGVDLPFGSEEAQLAGALAFLDASIDARLGAKGAAPLKEGPVHLQLRALLRKHGAADHDRPGLEPAVLVERLQEKLAEAGVLKGVAR
jgi:hypothetical protein